MDRLDTWLNSQLGWRRFAFVLLQIGPIFVLLAFGCLGFFYDPLPSFGLLLVGVIALGLVAAIAISFLQIRSHDRRDSTARRGAWAPLITWRGLVYNPVVCSPLLFVTLTLNASPAWHQQHQHAVHIGIFVLLPCMLFVLWERPRYLKRVRDRATYHLSH